jgi:hypothetical protein
MPACVSSTPLRIHGFVVPLLRASACSAKRAASGRRFSSASVRA